MVFNTTQAWATRSEPEFFLGEEKVAYTQSYTYLGVTFKGPQYSLTGVAFAQLSDGYAAVGCSRKTTCTFAVPRVTN